MQATLQATLDAIAILDQAQGQACREPGPGYVILAHARRRFDSEISLYLTGHE